MATFRFEINNKRPTRNKTYVVWLRITANGKRKLVKTSIEIKSPKDFNSKARQEKWIRASEPNSAKWNDELTKILKKAKETYQDLKEDGQATSEKIALEMTLGERPFSFLQYAKERTAEIYQAGGFRNWKKYNGFINKLEGFLADKNGNCKDITFAELTPSFLSKFEAYLHTLKNERQPEKKLHPNTIQVIFNIFKTLVNRAIEIEGLMKPEKNPFMVFTYKGVKTMKDKLNEEEIKLIEELSLPKDSPLWHCKNYFLFSFYCAGIRAGDLIQLRWKNITSEARLEYEMGKNHKYRDVYLIDKAKDILKYYYKEESNPSDYIFPLLENEAPYAKAITQENKDTLPPELKVKLFNQIGAKNALINKSLNKLAEKAGIEKHISFHIARHSFAKVAKGKHIDNSNLKSLFAHSSVKITEGYMGDFDTSENDKAMATIFEEKESPKDKLKTLLEKMSPEEMETLIKTIKKE